MDHRYDQYESGGDFFVAKLDYRKNEILNSKKKEHIKEKGSSN